MKTRLLAFVFILMANLAIAQTPAIGVSGLTFTPSTLTVDVGETIDINIGGHVAQEVTEATWNVGGTTSNGGFSKTGTTTLTLSTPGTYYYVCNVSNHAAQGMKGIIIVESPTGVKPNVENLSLLEINPNPVNSVSSINFSLKTQAEIEVVIFNSLGVKIMDLGKKSYTSGEHKVDFDAATMEDGLYTATIIVDGETATSKKIIIKK